MKTVLVVGLGRFGRHVIEKMSSLKYQVMAIDKDEERVNHILPYVTNAQIGDSTDEDFMKTVGVRNFDLCVVAIGDDFQSSLESTCLLKELGAPMVVSRASRDVQVKFLLRNGADEVVYPEKQMAEWTAIRYSSDHIVNYVQLESGFDIFELEMPENWVNKTIGQLDVRRKFSLNILGIRENGKIDMDITTGTVFKEGMTVLVLGRTEAVKKCFHI